VILQIRSNVKRLMNASTIRLNFSRNIYNFRCRFFSVLCINVCNHLRINEKQQACESERELRVQALRRSRIPASCETRVQKSLSNSSFRMRSSLALFTRTYTTMATATQRFPRSTSTAAHATVQQRLNGVWVLGMENAPDNRLTPDFIQHSVSFSLYPLTWSSGSSGRGGRSLVFSPHLIDPES
jgi:hypothetical protein